MHLILGDDDDGHVLAEEPLICFYRFISWQTKTKKGMSSIGSLTLISHALDHYFQNPTGQQPAASTAIQPSSSQHYHCLLIKNRIGQHCLVDLMRVDCIIQHKLKIMREHE